MDAEGLAMRLVWNYGVRTTCFVELERSHYCEFCDVRQDVFPGPHKVRCPEFVGIGDFSVLGNGRYGLRVHRPTVPGGAVL